MSALLKLSYLFPEEIQQQNDIISSMEGDLVVYEAHVSILRESLSMTKREEQQLIKSKAFAAKLNVLEREKDVISKRNRGWFLALSPLFALLDEKLRTKALNAKIRNLEGERDELVESIMSAQCLLQQYAESKASGKRSCNNSVLSVAEEAPLLRRERTVEDVELGVSLGQDLDDTQPHFHEHEVMDRLTAPAAEASVESESHSDVGTSAAPTSAFHFQATSALHPPQSSKLVPESSLVDLENRLQVRIDTLLVNCTLLSLGSASGE